MKPKSKSHLSSLESLNFGKPAKRSLASGVAVFFAATGLTCQAALIINGDFELGNTGFTSDYTYQVPGPPDLDANEYTVDTNPFNSHSLFYSMGDNTTGSGQMMIINGAATTGIPVWSSTVSSGLTIGEEYDFSAYVASVHPSSPAVLTFKVGATELGDLSPDSDGSWKRLFATFTALEEFPIFSLVNANGTGFGNDFALDDIDVFVPGTTVNPPTVPTIPTTPNGVPDTGGSAMLFGLALGTLAFLRKSLNLRTKHSA